MDKTKLQQHLFSERAHLYAVLDGVMVPDLPNVLYDEKVPNECLWSGDLTPDKIYTAPYLVGLKRNSKFSDWVFEEALGKHWGIFIHSTRSMVDTKNHFRSMLLAYDERGNPLRFRYYDPRVLRKYLPTCNMGELKTVFGNSEAIFIESDDPDKILRFEIGKDGLKATELN
jgi:hypothetical protein